MRIVAKDIAVISVMVALLIGGQLLFTAISGVEIVTVLLLSFAYSFGAKRGMLVATAFSLLRCLLWGFYPSVVTLYLIYYNLFALLFGVLGHGGLERRIKAGSVIVTELLFLILCSVPISFLLGKIKISIMLQDGLTLLSWLILLLAVTGVGLYTAFLAMAKGNEKYFATARVVSVVVAASVCTVCFTLLDDVLTPLFYGFSYKTAVAYFYTSFSAMLPQTLCTMLTVGVLFYPLTKIFNKAAKSMRK